MFTDPYMAFGLEKNTGRYERDWKTIWRRRQQRERIKKQIVTTITTALMGLLVG